MALFKKTKKNISEQEQSLKNRGYSTVSEYDPEDVRRARLASLTPFQSATTLSSSSSSTKIQPKITKNALLDHNMIADSADSQTSTAALIDQVEEKIIECLSNSKSPLKSLERIYEEHKSTETISDLVKSYFTTFISCPSAFNSNYDSSSQLSLQVFQPIMDNNELYISLYDGLDSEIQTEILRAYVDYRIAVSTTFETTSAYYKDLTSLFGVRSNIFIQAMSGFRSPRGKDAKHAFDSSIFSAPLANLTYHCQITNDNLVKLMKNYDLVISAIEELVTTWMKYTDLNNFQKTELFELTKSCSDALKIEHEESKVPKLINMVPLSIAFTSLAATLKPKQLSYQNYGDMKDIMDGFSVFSSSYARYAVEMHETAQRQEPTLDHMRSHNAPAALIDRFAAELKIKKDETNFAAVVFSLSSKMLSSSSRFVAGLARLFSLYGTDIPVDLLNSFLSVLTTYEFSMTALNPQSPYDALVKVLTNSCPILSGNYPFSIRGSIVTGLSRASDRMDQIFNVMQYDAKITFLNALLTHFCSLDKDLDYERSPARWNTMICLQNLFKNSNLLFQFSANCASSGSLSTENKFISQFLKEMNNCFDKSIEHLSAIASSANEEERARNIYYLGTPLHFFEISLDFMLEISAVAAPVFLSKTCAERTICTLDYFLDSLAGSRSKEIKIKNASEHRFYPGTIICKILSILAYLARDDNDKLEVAKIMHEDQRSWSALMMSKVIKIAERLNKVSSIQFEYIDSLFAAILELETSAQISEEPDDSEIPDDFCDPISMELMECPMKLPSGHILDKGVLEQLLLSSSQNPFTREPLVFDQCVVDTELADKIKEWKKAHSK